MIYTIYPTKDTTLYSHASAKSYNYGLDEVLELTKHISHSMISGEHSSRAVLNFTASDYNHISGKPSSSYLQIYCAHEQEISRDYSLVIGRGQDFANGTGTYIRSPKAIDGANWDYSDNQSSTAWRANFPATESNHATESIQYHTLNKSPFALDTYNPDIYQDVLTNVSQSSNHDGLIAFSIHRGTQEADGKSYGSLKFFSNESKTIFRPRIHLGFDTYTPNLNNITTCVTSSNMKISSEGKYNMTNDGVERIYFYGFNALNDTKSYSTSSKVSTRGAIALSGKAAYQIRDAVSNTVYHQIHKEYTRLSSTYVATTWMDIHTKSFIPEREYIVDIRIEDRTFTGQIEWYTDTHRFKTSRKGS
jgi:hypothetical protein